MFGFAKRCRWGRRPVDRCICHVCTCDNAPAHYYQNAGANVNNEPSLRIEYLQPLVVTQPVEQPNFVDNVNEVEPAPKDAPDDRAEFDTSWQEGADYE